MLNLDLDADQMAILMEEIDGIRTAATAAGYRAGALAAYQGAVAQADSTLAAAGRYDGTRAVSDLRQWLLDQIRLLGDPSTTDPTAIIEPEEAQ